MVDTHSLDLIVAVLALSIAIAGLWMLFGGISCSTSSLPEHFKLDKGLSVRIMQV